MVGDSGCKFLSRADWRSLKTIVLGIFVLLQIKIRYARKGADTSLRQAGGIWMILA